MERIRVAGIIPIEGGFALMHRKDVIKRKDYQNYYAFPGGGLEKGETLEQGTIREINEEFGIGERPEFSNDPKYIDSGKFIPEIIKRDEIKNILLLPLEIKDQFVKDIENGVL